MLSKCCVYTTQHAELSVPRSLTESEGAEPPPCAGVERSAELVHQRGKCARVEPRVAKVGFCMGKKGARREGSDRQTTMNCTEGTSWYGAESTSWYYRRRVKSMVIQCDGGSDESIDYTHATNIIGPHDGIRELAFLPLQPRETLQRKRPLGARVRCEVSVVDDCISTNQVEINVLVRHRHYNGTGVCESVRIYVVDVHIRITHRANTRVGSSSNEGHIGLHAKHPDTI